MKFGTFASWAGLAWLSACGSPDEAEVGCSVTPVAECVAAGCMLINGSPIVACEVGRARGAGCAEREAPINPLETCAIEPNGETCYHFSSSLVPATFTVAPCGVGLCASGEVCLRGPYQPCEGKLCGDACDPCDPFDPACPNRGQMLTCDQQGECVDPAGVECAPPSDPEVP